MPSQHGVSPRVARCTHHEQRRLPSRSAIRYPHVLNPPQRVRMNGRHKFSGELVWRQKSWAHSFVPKRCKNSCCGNVCTRLCVCVRAPVWLRGRDREGSVCGVCESVCVFSFKRRKTTVVTERSRKISYQIAEPILVPRGLKRAAASTINVSSRQYTVQKTKLSPLKTKPSPHLHVQLAGFFYYWHRLGGGVRVIS